MASSARRAAAPGLAPRFVDEAALAARWGDGVRGPLRLEDGRALAVVFPGVPGGGPGPDFVGAILEAGGDLLRGDVEVHLRASGWRAHGHHNDPAYAGVVLHVVAENDTRALATLSGAGRAIAVLVVGPARGATARLPGFTPPCAFARARGYDVPATLERMSLRRLRVKAARAAAMAPGAPGQALYALLLETLGGAANRAAFAALARMLPLAALIDRCDGAPLAASRAFAATVALKGAAAGIVLRRAGLRPLASPARRLVVAGAAVAALWPRGAPPAFPAALTTAAGSILRLPGLGRAAAIEVAVNAVLPAALASGEWAEAAVEAAWLRLPAPGTYGRLRRLSGWIGGAGEPPFTTAARLQGGLALFNDYCTRGHCGACPLSS